MLVHGGAHALATRLGALQDHLHKLGEGGLAVGGPEPGPQPDVGSQDLVLVSRHDSGNPWIRSSAANRLIGEVLQSQRRPLLGHFHTINPNSEGVPATHLSEGGG